MNEDKAPLLSTHLVISGRNFDPDLVSETLGLKPTAIWRQQRQHLDERQDFANVEWQIGFDQRPLYSTDDAVAEVLEIVWPARERMRDFLLSRKDLAVALVCSVKIQGDRPEYCLSPGVLEKLAWLGCEFCLDIFDYSD